MRLSEKLNGQPYRPGQDRGDHHKAEYDDSAADQVPANVRAILVNVVLRLVPSACTVAMIATEMPAASRPYSIAVAPV